MPLNRLDHRLAHRIQRTQSLHRFKNKTACSASYSSYKTSMDVTTTTNSSSTTTKSTHRDGKQPSCLGALSYSQWLDPRPHPLSARWPWPKLPLQGHLFHSWQGCTKCICKCQVIVDPMEKYLLEQLPLILSLDA